MSSVRKVAFIANVSSACIHRRIRGALSYADANSRIVIRDFRLPADFAHCADPVAALKQLRDWNPDGVLSYLETAEIDRLIHMLSRPAPIVNMCAVRLRPGVVMVGGSVPRMIEVAVRHFRQQGLRSVGMLLLEDASQMQTNFVGMFNQIAEPADIKQATLVEAVAPALLFNPEASVKPVPSRIAAWLRQLPKPTGVFCSDYGGGGYLIRVCHVLGLRMPEDIAVIGTDDVDMCLACNPTLTSAVPASEMIGQEAMRTLDQIMNGQPAPTKPVRVEATDLHVRQSTGLKGAEICDIAAAVNYINQHACRDLSVEQLLQKTQHVSKMTFHKYFLAATGQTPGEAIRQRQFEEARRLLAETELSITLVAENSGFGSSSDFARAFRAVQGITPSEYRAGAKGEARQATR
jgi:LacI family transcriptional regulator